LRLALARDHRARPGSRACGWRRSSEERFVSLRPTSALRRLTDGLCDEAGFEPDVVFEA
jgi:hypothetical protein